MKIEVLIEKGLDGSFDVYLNPDQVTNLTFGLLGQGTSIKDAIADFYNSANEMKTYYKEIGKSFPENPEFVFSYDVPSFLAYYKGTLSLTGLERITGINSKQLNHYVTGVRKPSSKTIRKIEQSLHTFGRELAEIQLVS